MLFLPSQKIYELARPDCAAAAAVRKYERKEVGSWTWFMNEIPQIALHKNPV